MGFRLSQEKYAKTVQPINVKRYRKSDPDSKLTSDEITACRAILGQAQWLSTQTMPQIAVHVSMLQPIVNSATVKDLGRINQLVKAIHEFSGTGITVHPYLDMAWVCWFDASWCSRADGSSQGGYVLCTTEKAALQGKKHKFTVFTRSFEEVDQEVPFLSRS